VQERGLASVRRLTPGWTRSFAGTCEAVILWRQLTDDIHLLEEGDDQLFRRILTNSE